MELLGGPRYLELRGCVVDFAACVARWPDGERTLTPTETRLLRYLSLQEGRAVERQELLREVWGYRGGVVTRTVKTTMGRLRAKVERDPREPDHLLTVTGVGYRFAELAELAGEPSANEPRPTMPADEPTRSNLPSALAELVGREEQLTRLTENVQSGARLVTLVGTGGIGKSALMLRFAANELPDGGWREIRVADLSSCTRGEDVIRAVATALDARVSADDLDGGVLALAGVLKGRGAILLLLDDAERCAADLALVLSRWLDECPRAAFLVTSRELLRIAGEVPLPVAPLGLEGGVALFRRRVGASVEGYGDDAAVAPLVDQLDCIPLAIEMAAAWADLLGPDALLKRLSGQLDLLQSDRRDRPARHESLRATVASSWELLEENERSGLRELGVFAGAFGVEDAEAVLGSSGSVLGLLRRLRERSLLRAELISDDDEPRFRLFRAVRDYAREQGADESASLRHGLWLARWGAPEMLRRLAREGGSDVDRLVIAREDLAIAARRAVLREDTDVAVPCARGLSLLAELRGPALGDETLLERVSRMQGLPEADRAWIQLERGLLLAGLGSPDQARRSLDDAVRSSVALQDRDRAILLARVAETLLDRDPEEADALARGAVLAGDADDDDASLGLALAVQARIENQLGRTAEAEEHLDRALALLRVSGEKRAEARALQDLAALHAERGRPLRGHSLYEQALRLRAEVHDRHARPPLLDRMAGILAEQGQLGRAMRTWDEALTEARDCGDRRIEAQVRAHRAVSQRRAEVGEGCRHELLAALTVTREVGDRALEAELLRELGELDLSLGHLAAADSYLQRAVQLARRLGLPAVEGAGRGALGELGAARGQLDEARRELSDGRLLLEDSRRRLALVELLERWAEVEAGAGDEQSASRLLLEAASAGELSVVDGPIL